MRPSWDTYFMGMAEAAATRATCDRRHVGAVIVVEGHIVSTGYNGSPPGMAHCDDNGHQLQIVDGRESCTRTIHAEENAILAAAKFGHRIQGGTIYTTTQPCAACAKRIIATGLKRVVFSSEYDSGAGMEILRGQGVALANVHANLPRGS